MTQQTEKNISKILHRLFGDKVIDNALFNSPKPRGSQLPRMYGLPKIHKNSVPLRPILAMMSSPQHKLARWLASIIDPIRKSIGKFSLKDSFEFAHRLEDKNSCTSFMVSFDVVSLFTNIPLEETIDIVCKYSAMINIPEDKLCQLLLLCTKNVQFTFNGQIYRQVIGVAMGSPLGPILADIFLSLLENKLNGVIQDTHLYVRYVNDTFLLCRNKNQAKQLPQIFDLVRPNMKFTMEEEHSNRLSFVDVSIPWKDSKFIRSINHKDTWMGQYIPLVSFCPIQTKNGLVRNLFIRAYRLCSQETIQQEVELLETILKDN